MKNILKTEKRQTTELKKIFASHISEGFPSRISKELSQFSNKTDDPVLKTGNVLELIHLQ